MNSIFLVLTSCFLFGCPFFKKETVVYNDIKIDTVPQDFLIPRKIFNIVQGKTGEANSNYYIFSPLEVAISSDSADVIAKSPLRFIFPNGGGRLDLKNYISGQGTFYISFPPEQFKGLPELAHLFFISDSSRKKIDDETFGLGCGYFVDLKSKFNSLKKGDYLKLNTTDQRYIHVASGFYIFIFKESSKFYLTHVHVYDSRYPDYMCSTMNQK